MPEHRLAGKDSSSASSTFAARHARSRDGSAARSRARRSERILLVGTDLMDVDVVISGGYEALDCSRVRFWIRTANERARNVFLSGQAQRLVERAPGWQSR